MKPEATSLRPEVIYTSVSIEHFIPCSVEEYWGEMTEEDWDALYEDKYHEGKGG